jgi:uncharacterized protein
MKRILALDGGGIRGVFTLEILLHMQEMLRKETGKPSIVLADHFDFFAGTSTGAIIATCLSWGMDVGKVMDLYVEHGKKMFQHVPWSHPIKRMFFSRYDPKPLSDILQKMFSEDDLGNVPALLSTKRLKTLLLVVVRNATTGSAWPITNNPKAKYNLPDLPDCNMNVPLWKIIRASTAAPVYFDPEEIILGGRKYVFMDGSITPYNNPALIAALTAVLPSYNVGWEPGPDKIRLISVGTTRVTSASFDTAAKKMWLGYHLPRIPAALIQGIALEQDYICRCLGECLFGEALDSEVGNLVGMQVGGPKWFSYVRYNQSFLGKEAEEVLAKSSNLSKLDAIQAIPLLRELGHAYAEKNMKLDHLV